MISDPLSMVDAGGHIFDAARHLAKDGKPTLNKKTGRFMPRGGRKPKPKPPMDVSNVPPPAALPPVSAVPPVPEPVAPPPTPEPPPVNFDDINRAATGAAVPNANAVIDGLENNTAETCIGIIQMALMLIGQEEGMLSEAEKLCVRQPLVRVLNKWNIGSDVMPAELELAMAFASLIIIRLQKPKTATFFAKVKLWFVNLWFRKKGREVMREAKAEFAHSPNGFVPPAPPVENAA